MQMWHRLSGWFRSRRTAEKVMLQNLLIWLIAAGLVVYLARGLSLRQLADTLAHCDLTLFLLANISALLIRWLADTYLLATLFSFFHGRTTYREVLPASTAQYFLQSVSVLVADGALVLFLHQRKGVEWITAGWTIAFQGFVDAILIAAITVTAALLIPWSPIRLALPYAAMALAFFVCVAAWWMHGRSISRPGRWLRARRGMRAFRAARPYHYIALATIRLIIFVPNVIAYYFYFASFRLKVPLAAVLALSPALMFAQNAPVLPSGLGLLQAIIVDGFARFAHRNDLLAAALGVSIVQLLCRLPMGLGMAGVFARTVLAVRPVIESSSGSQGDSRYNGQ
jgi:hypothetical protein